MRKIAVASILLGVFCLSGFAQSSRKTRPRVVKLPTSKSTPDADATSVRVKKRPVLINDTQDENKTRRPPVLVNGTSSKAPSTELPPPPPITVTDVEDEIIKVETNFVTLPVTVLDRNGRFISGLGQREFKIFENGVEQKVEYFASVEKPFTVVLLLDVSPSTQYQIDQIHRAATSFVNQLRTQDKVMVVAFDQGYKVLVRPTSDRFRLREAIRRARFGSGTSLYDAVSTTIDRELRNISGRKAIVLFTDGVDTTSRNSNYQSTLRRVEEVDALIYPIRYDTYSTYSGGRRGPNGVPRRTGNKVLDILGKIMTGGNINVQGGAGTSAKEYSRGKAYLTELARYSGGRIFEADTAYNLDSAFRSIAEELRRQYSLGYYPETGKKGDRRQIRVRVMRRNLVVRTKRSYIVGQNGS